MHFFKFIAGMLSICLFAHPLHADGTFYIGEDEGGVYFQTDLHGGWYINEQDLMAFKIGETGRYYVKTDRNGKYIKTKKHGKFYLDLEAKKQLEKEILQFNSEQEEKWEKLKAKETQRKELEIKKNSKKETNEDTVESNEKNVTVSYEYRYPYGVWSSPYRYGRYGTVIHHKIRSPKWINKHSIKKRHHRIRPSLRHHRNIPYKMQLDINGNGLYNLRM